MAQHLLHYRQKDWQSDVQQLSARDGDYVIFGPHGLIEVTSGGDRATKKLQACGLESG